MNLSIAVHPGKYVLLDGGFIRAVVGAVEATNIMALLGHPVRRRRVGRPITFSTVWVERVILARTIGRKANKPNKNNKTNKTNKPK